MVKDKLWNQSHQVHIADQPLPGCVLLNKLLISINQKMFPHLYCGDNNSPDSNSLTSWDCHEGCLL